MRFEIERSWGEVLLGNPTQATVLASTSATCREHVTYRVGKVLLVWKHDGRQMIIMIWRGGEKKRIATTARSAV